MKSWLGWVLGLVLCLTVAGLVSMRDYHAPIPFTTVDYQIQRSGPRQVTVIAPMASVREASIALPGGLESVEVLDAVPNFGDTSPALLTPATSGLFPPMIAFTAWAVVAVVSLSRGAPAHKIKWGVGTLLALSSFMLLNLATIVCPKPVVVARSATWSPLARPTFMFDGHDRLRVFSSEGMPPFRLVTRNRQTMLPGIDVDKNGDLVVAATVDLGSPVTVANYPLHLLSHRGMSETTTLRSRVSSTKAAMPVAVTATEEHSVRRRVLTLSRLQFERSWVTLAVAGFATMVATFIGVARNVRSEFLVMTGLLISVVGYCLTVGILVPKGPEVEPGIYQVPASPVLY